MRAPLLIDPGAAERPERERVDVRQPVLRDQPAVDERQPAVLDDEERQREGEQTEPERDDHDRQRLPLEQSAQPQDRAGNRRGERALGGQNAGRHLTANLTIDGARRAGAGASPVLSAAHAKSAPNEASAPAITSG